MINKKNDIIKQIDLTKKKVENLKIKINKYDHLSNKLLYNMDEFIKLLK